MSSYALLPSNDLDGDHDSRVIPLWVQLCSVTALTLALLNIAFPLLPGLPGASPTALSRSERLQRASELYRPSIYIGIDRVDRAVAQAALPDALHVFPHVFQPVSRAEPTRVFPSDGRARLTFNGLVSPGEPHVVINKNVSMIMQTRVQDHNLRRCALSSFMPDLSELATQNRTLVLARESVNLEVWALDASASELDLTSLSWRTRPARTALLSDLVVQARNHTHSVEFDCGREGALRTFELACPEGAVEAECAVEFWQEQPETKPRMAITVVQKPSI